MKIKKTDNLGNWSDFNYKNLIGMILGEIYPYTSTISALDLLEEFLEDNPSFSCLLEYKDKKMSASYINIKGGVCDDCVPFSIYSNKFSIKILKIVDLNED